MYLWNNGSSDSQNSGDVQEGSRRNIDQMESPVHVRLPTPLNIDPKTFCGFLRSYWRSYLRFSPRSGSSFME